MASGKAHAKTSILGGLWAWQMAVWYGLPAIAGPLMVIGSALGILLSPDLDIPTYTWIENTLRKSSVLPVKLFGWAYIIYWWPYSKLIPHRHWLSHAPIIGTFLRIVYLTPLLLCATIMVGVPSPEFYLESIQWVLLGLVWSDVLHWLYDL